MKIRNGHVSNSSSSSFIIGMKPMTDNDNFKATISMDVDFKNYTHTILKTIKDVVTYLTDDYCCELSELNDTKSHVGQMYFRMKKEIEQGNYVLVGSFANDTGEGLETMLCEIGIPKNTPGVNIIQSDGGY